MRVFGNLTNRIQEGSSNITPVVGMGATILMFSDRYATTIIEVSPKKIVVQRDKAIRTDNHGQSDSQSYRYEPQPETGEKFTATLRKNGAWIMEGESLRSGTHLRLDRRDEFYDYGF